MAHASGTAVESFLGNLNPVHCYMRAELIMIKGAKALDLSAADREVAAFALVLETVGDRCHIESDR
jgi:hypothetical protein